MRKLTIVIFLVSFQCCRSVERAEPIAGKYSDSISNNDSIVTKTSDVARTETKLKEFNSIKDLIDIEEVLKNTFKDGDRAKISINSKSYTISDLIYHFAIASKNGNSEIEQWLLSFFEGYVEGIIEWNGSCGYCDGVGGKPDLFMSHLSQTKLRLFNLIPPSQEKVRIIMLLFNQEPDTYWAGRDHAPMINGNEIVLELLLENIPYHLRPYRKYISEYSERAEKDDNRIVLELYNQIKNGEIALIDRETWKSM